MAAAKAKQWLAQNRPPVLDEIERGQVAPSRAAY